jgi:hypothetical protein
LDELEVLLREKYGSGPDFSSLRGNELQLTKAHENVTGIDSGDSDSEDGSEEEQAGDSDGEHSGPKVQDNDDNDDNDDDDDDDDDNDNDYNSSDDGSVPNGHGPTTNQKSAGNKNSSMSTVNEDAAVSLSSGQLEEFADLQAEFEQFRVRLVDTEEQLEDSMLKRDALEAELVGQQTAKDATEKKAAELQQREDEFEFEIVSDDNRYLLGNILKYCAQCILR